MIPGFADALVIMDWHQVGEPEATLSGDERGRTGSGIATHGWNQELARRIGNGGLIAGDAYIQPVPRGAHVVYGERGVGAQPFLNAEIPLIGVGVLDIKIGRASCRERVWY